MKVIVTGATGMVGKGVLLECLDHKDITEVLSISRRSLEIQHPKLKELIHRDFSEFESVQNKLKGYDACYACMGVSSAGMKEDEYTRLTYDFTMSLAKVLFQKNPNMTYTYVSGVGTATNEKGSMWARVKGKTENDLLKLGFKQAFMFRPGMIIPKRGVEPSSKIYKVFINNLKWLMSFIKWMAPKSVVDSIQIGQAMINVTQDGYDKEVLHPQDILVAAET
jgi:hypothetical protein